MVFQWLGELPVVVGAPLFVGLVVLISIGAGLLVHRFVPYAVLEQHNEIAGFVFAVLGVIYAVLLGFLAVGAWQHLQNAEDRTYEEAARLIVVYRKADNFPQNHMLRSELRAYVSEIINRSWPALQHGGSDEQVIDMGERLANHIRHLPVRTSAQQNLDAAMIASMDEALVDRDSREAVADVGMSIFLWGILMAGAVFTIGFSYLFAYRTRGSLIAIVGLLAAMVGLVLYLVAAVDYPYRGEIRIGPEAFVHALHVFDAIGH